MKKQLITFISTAIFFLLFHNSLAQSFATSSENVTIKIVKKISVIINKNEEKSSKRNNFWEKIKTPRRNLLLSYNHVRNHLPNSSVSVSLSKHYKNSIVKSGEQKEIKNLSDDEKLYISIKDMKQTESVSQKHFVTIVY